MVNKIKYTVGFILISALAGCAYEMQSLDDANSISEVVAEVEESIDKEQIIEAEVVKVEELEGKTKEFVTGEWIKDEPWISQIKAGDFSNVKDGGIRYPIEILDTMYRNIKEKPHEWILVNLRDDEDTQLVWQEGEGLGSRVIAIFRLDRTSNEIYVVHVQAGEYYHEYTFMPNGKLFHVYPTYSAVVDYYFAEITFDEEWNRQSGKGLSAMIIDDLESMRESYRKSNPEIEENTWYFRVWSGVNDEVTFISKEEFFLEFFELTGMEFIDFPVDRNVD